MAKTVHYAYRCYCGEDGAFHIVIPCQDIIKSIFYGLSTNRKSRVTCDNCRRTKAWFEFWKELTPSPPRGGLLPLQPPQQ
jgi:hypothetical protein